MHVTARQGFPCFHLAARPERNYILIRQVQWKLRREGKWAREIGSNLKVGRDLQVEGVGWEVEVLGAEARKAGCIKFAEKV